MGKYETPDRLRKRDHHLLEAFLQSASQFGIAEDEATGLFKMLPSEIKNAPTFLDALSNVWMYEYGHPYDVDAQRVIGGSLNHRADFLLIGVKKLSELASSSELLAFLQKLPQPDKHQDFVAELDPLVRGVDCTSAAYEPSEFSPDGNSLDWQLEFSDGSSCLLDVKNRLTGILDLLRNQGRCPADPNGIFRDVEKKYCPADTARPQGVWIWSYAKFDESKLHDEFAMLDASRVQFAVLSHSDAELQVLTEDDGIRDWLQEHFYAGTEVGHAQQKPRKEDLANQ